MTKVRKWLRFRVLFPALARLPVRFACKGADYVGQRDARRHPGRETVRARMAEMVPALREDRQALDLAVQAHYQMQAKDILDCFLTPDFGRRVHALVKVKNIETLVAAKEAGRGVILVMSHFSRFFMLAPALRFAGVGFGVLTTMVDERHPSYDAIDRWYVGTKLRNAFAHCQGLWVTTGDDIRKVYRALEAGEVMLIAFDGNETTSRTRYEFPFCGGTLSLPEGIVRIAQKTGAKLVFAGVVDHGPCMEAILHPLPDDPVQALGQAVELLEKNLLAYPAQWWQWEISHLLWRPQPPQNG